MEYTYDYNIYEIELYIEYTYNFKVYEIASYMKYTYGYKVWLYIRLLIMVKYSNIFS